MTDTDEPIIGLRVSSEPGEVRVAQNGPSVGQQLQRARLDAGLSLEIVSARLKVSVARLQAFESDQFEHGSNVHIGRAMVASVARFLGLDSQALLAQLPLPKVQSPVAGSPEAVGGFGRETRLTMRRDPLGPVSPLWWIALVLLVLAALVYFYPQLAPVSHLQPVASLSQAGVPTAQSGPQNTTESAAPVALASASIAELPVAHVAPDRSGSAEKAVQSVLEFKARGSTWIEVTDAKGTVLLRRTLAATEAVQVGGDLPLSVVVGRADHTEVIVRGAPFPLETHTQDNVARFKVP